MVEDGWTNRNQNKGGRKTRTGKGAIAWKMVSIGSQTEIGWTREQSQAAEPDSGTSANSLVIVAVQVDNDIKDKILWM
jgi:hypothetical protein